MPVNIGLQALSSCPGREDLFAFSIGNLSQELREAVAAHIEGCGACLAALVTLEDEADPFVAEFRKPVPPDLEEYVYPRPAAETPLAEASPAPTLASAELP